MKKVYYEKVGRKYVAVSEYDSDFQDAFRKGTHIIMSYPGGQSRRYEIDPAFGPLIAAGRYAEEAMSAAMLDASELKPQQTPITEKQQRAWRQLEKAFDNDLCALTGAAVADIAAAGINALQEEANKLMQHEAVKQAYEQFLLVVALTKDHAAQG